MKLAFGLCCGLCLAALPARAQYDSDAAGGERDSAAAPTEPRGNAVPEPPDHDPPPPGLLPPSPSQAAAGVAPASVEELPSTPAGQWLYTSLLGWIWAPRGAEFVDAGGTEPHTFVYVHHGGWRWVVAPWVWGNWWPYDHPTYDGAGSRWAGASLHDWRRDNVFHMAPSNANDDPWGDDFGDPFPVGSFSLGSGGTDADDADGMASDDMASDAADSGDEDLDGAGWDTSWFNPVKTASAAPTPPAQGAATAPAFNPAALAGFGQEISELIQAEMRLPQFQRGWATHQKGKASGAWSSPHP